MSFFKKFLKAMAETSIPSVQNTNVHTPANDLVYIEYLTEVNHWYCISSTTNDSFFIASGLQQAKRQYPDNRVRAITQDGRVLDMMM
jgi:hypothetical protein